MPIWKTKQFWSLQLRYFQQYVLFCPLNRLFQVFAFYLVPKLDTVSITQSQTNFVKKIVRVTKYIIYHFRYNWFTHIIDTFFRIDWVIRFIIHDIYFNTLCNYIFCHVNNGSYKTFKHPLQTIFSSLMRLVALQLAFENAVSSHFTLFQGVLPIFCCFETFLPSLSSVHSGITITCLWIWGLKKVSAYQFTLTNGNAESPRARRPFRVMTTNSSIATSSTLPKSIKKTVTLPCLKSMASTRPL